MASLVDFAYYGALMLASPWVLYKVGQKRGRRHIAGLKERLGDCPRRQGNRPCVWIHGVSVGEIRAAATLVEAIEREMPEFEIVLSTTTETGQGVAKRTYPDKRVFYFPIDFSWSVSRVFSAIRPDMVILVELEIWPNFLQEAQRRRIPIALVNGRITSKSYRGYRLVRGWLFDPIGKIGTFCVQTERYADRFRRLGIPDRHIHVTGSVKYDELQGQPAEASTVRKDLGVADDEVVLMAGSTHPGEELALMRTYETLRVAHPHLRLVLVPRHSERTKEVVAQLERLGATVALRTQRLAGENRDPIPPSQVILVDTVGELGRLYNAADLVFIGGSLIPHGGQNMLEPVMFGKPTLFGPYDDNFREPVDRLLAADGALRVDDEPALLAALETLLANPDQASAMGERGRRALTDAQGATTHTIGILKAFAEERIGRLVGAKSHNRRRPGDSLRPASLDSDLT